MELKTFKTYLKEQEKLDEFVGAIAAGAARLVPSIVRSVRSVGIASKNILRNRSTNAALNAASIGSNMMGNNQANAEQMPIEQPLDVDPGAIQPATSVKKINPVQSATPQPVGSISANNRNPPQFSGANTAIQFQSMYGGLRGKMGRI